MASETSRAPRPVVLTVDDEPGVRAAIRQVLKDEYDIVEAPDAPSALAQLQARDVDLVLLDVRLPGQTGLDLLERIKALEESVEVVMVTAVNDVRTAVEAIRRGAYDYVVKPFDVDDLSALAARALEKRALQREVLYLRSELAGVHGFDEIVGRHAEMVRIYERIAQVAETTATVLITGESGTGKELIARAIHRQGPRRDRPFVAVNMAAIAEPLLESELFGHEKGAFTGAYQRKLGKFELAHGGSLFLDEVATLRVDLQAKLLRVLQEREIERVGGTRTVKVDIRIIAATNANLRQAVRERTFREDLFYRLNVVPIAVPPLRDRREDIPALVTHFLRKYNRDFGKSVRGVSAAAMPVLLEYDWPGNVRELENIIERSVALAAGPVIHLSDLPLDLALPETAPGRDEPGPGLREARDRFERQFVLRALERAGWNQSRAARLLGLHRNTLMAKLAAWGVRRADPGAAAGDSAG